MRGSCSDMVIAGYTRKHCVAVVSNRIGRLRRFEVTKPWLRSNLRIHEIACRRSSETLTDGSLPLRSSVARNVAKRCGRKREHSLRGNPHVVGQEKMMMEPMEPMIPRRIGQVVQLLCAALHSHECHSWPSRECSSRITKS